MAMMMIHLQMRRILTMTMEKMKNLKILMKRMKSSEKSEIGINLQTEDQGHSPFSILALENETLIVTMTGTIVIQPLKISSTRKAIWRVKNGWLTYPKRSLMLIFQILSITNSVFSFE